MGSGQGFALSVTARPLESNENVRTTSKERRDGNKIPPEEETLARQPNVFLGLARWGISVGGRPEDTPGNRA